MSEGFSDPTTAGDDLVIPAVQSPNFVAGSAGWRIARDGSAEFNDVVIRNGQIVSGTSLYYSSDPPADGTLEVAISATAGSDGLGNSWGPGVTIFGISGPDSDLTFWDGIIYLAGTQAQISGLGDGSIAIGPANGQQVGITGNIVATGGTLSVPTKITTDTWTEASAFGTDWAVSTEGVDGVLFRLGTDGIVKVYIDVKTSGAAPSATMCDIPAGYAPAASTGCGAVCPSSGGAAYPVSALSTGTLSVGGVPAASGVRYFGEISYPLAAI